MVYVPLTLPSISQNKANRRYWFLAGLGLCLVPLTTVFLAAFNPSGAETALRAGVIALGCFGLVQLGRQAAFARRFRQFDDAFGPSPLAYCLTDQSGYIHRINLAFKAQLKDLADREIADAFGALCGHSDKTCLRLLQRCRTDGWAQESFSARTGAGGTISVETCGGDLVLWRVLADSGGQNGPEAEPAGPEAIALVDLPVALLKLRDSGLIVSANPAAQILFGAQSLIGQNFCDIAEGLARPMTVRLREAAAGNFRPKSEMARRLNAETDVFFQVNLMRIGRAADCEILATLNDATELKSLEAQFVQSQKMQAVGQLAGGVAHDFNNLLTAINGHCDLLLLRHSTGGFDHEDLVQIRQNADRAAALVRQLLAFSRKQTLQPKTIRLSRTLSELTHLLNRLLGEKVTLTIDLVPDLLPVRVDERQFEQVILNLVVNARDAMPKGGVVHISCRNIRFDRDHERGHAIMPGGEYVTIEVRDTGSGMNAEQLGKIFEPFYTTKRVGEGTGLGLSTAYGIIKQTGGFIFADSVTGAGSTFSIFLPASPADKAAVVLSPDPRIVPLRDLTGQGRILLVEDEAAVRSFAARSLRLRGYTVLESGSGDQALALLQDRDVKVDMFISDVIMPGTDGPTWVRRALLDRPDVKVIFVSGYAEDAFENGSPNVANSVFLPKPFSLTDLTRMVKEQFVRQAEPEPIDSHSA